MEQTSTQFLERRAFPPWHYSMLNDKFRNGVIEAAIKAADIRGKRIVEIGTGAGLTAIFFARHGAKEVITCEMNPQVYELAKTTIQESGLASTIKILNKSSTQAIRDGDIQEPPDVIFTETLDCGVIGEGFYTVARDIQLIRGPRTEILPGRVDQYGMLICSNAIHELNSVASVSNIRFEHLNFYKTKTYYPVHAYHYKYHALSGIKKVRSYRYDHGVPEDVGLVFKAHVSDECHGLLSFFSAHYGEHTTGNNPAIPSHWHQAFHPLPDPVRLIAGNDYRFSFKFNGQIEFQGEA